MHFGNDPSAGGPQQCWRVDGGTSQGAVLPGLHRGLGTLSYYGMTALVVLYMVNRLLLPGHVEQIAGFAADRRPSSRRGGPLSTQALASQIFGLYTGFVYFTPLLGGLIRDRWIGQRNAVVVGALSMRRPPRHGLRAVIPAGAAAARRRFGISQGNISAQVGALYPRDDEARRTAALPSSAWGSISGRSPGRCSVSLLARALPCWPLWFRRGCPLHARGPGHVSFGLPASSRTRIASRTRRDPDGCGLAHLSRRSSW